ncbi:MAG: O-antigen ligase family protein [Anaerolineae bacterium]|nr:O-antigen ligase family protein [Anaerolineae bacterium]
MNTSRLSLFCGSALEAGWLLGVTITPVFFNVYSSRVFEPDKLTTLRALAVVMAVLWMVRVIDETVRGERPLRFSVKTPLVLPALATMGVYLISTLCSLVPFTSLIGSYQRLQGTYTLFAYLVIFFTVLTSLRTRVQLSRLVTVLILNSLPISLYGIIQHNGLDPLPWAGDVTSRVAANMGNSIFVAAYLIMIVPLTAARIVQSFGDILGREESRATDVLRASGYIFAWAVQLLTIWYSQSRGPWLGIVASAFLFPYLALIVLQRQAAAAGRGDSRGLRTVLRGIGFGWGSLALAGAVAGLILLVFEGTLAIYLAVGLALLIFGGLWLYFIVERKGWQWLWIGWGSVGLAIAVGMVLINIPGPLQQRVRQVSALQRLTTITELQSGTGKVRGLIWQGTVDLISIHEPIAFPDGTKDKLNFIRPLVGYGPESMYVAYNSFYPPELGHYESRTASPDRSHNETLDSLVITGVVGLAAYLFTFISVFAWGFHWLGLLRSRRDLLTYISIDVVIAIVFFILAWQLEGAYLFAVAIPLGILVGTMVYLTLQGFLQLFAAGRSGAEAQGVAPPAPHPHSLLLMGILAGVIAHFVEMNFGIAIASTRTTFWAYAALLVVLGLQWVPGLQESGVPGLAQDVQGRAASRTRSGRSSRPVTSQHSGLFAPWLTGVVALGLLSAFLLGTLAFDFVNNPDRLTEGGTVFIRSLTTMSSPEPFRAYGALMIIVFSATLFGVIGLSELDAEGAFGSQRRSRMLTVIGVYAGIAMVGFLLFGMLVAGFQASLTRVQVTTLDEVVEVADMLTGLLGYYYVLIFTIVILLGWTLMQEHRLPRDPGSTVGLLALGVLLLGAVFVIRDGSYNLIRADIIFKQGGVFANATTVNEKRVGIQHFERAIVYAPREDYYYLFLGKAYLELAQGLPDTTPAEEREALFLRTETVLTEARELNLLNTDHSANLARFYKSWAARVNLDRSAAGTDATEISRLDAKRQALLQNALDDYHTALTLSPNNPILWNELAQLYAIDLGDQQKYEETIARSLAVDDEFEQTWMLMGDLRSSQGDIVGAIEAYQRSLLIRDNCTVRRVVGTLMAQESLWDQATTTLEEAIGACPTDAELWEMYRVLAIAYANQGQSALALETAQAALSLAPEAQRSAIQQLIDQLTGFELAPEVPQPVEVP